MSSRHRQRAVTPLARPHPAARERLHLVGSRRAGTCELPDGACGDLLATAREGGARGLAKAVGGTIEHVEKAPPAQRGIERAPCGHRLAIARGRRELAEGIGHGEPRQRAARGSGLRSRDAGAIAREVEAGHRASAPRIHDRREAREELVPLEGAPRGVRQVDVGHHALVQQHLVGLDALVALAVAKANGAHACRRLRWPARRRTPPRACVVARSERGRCPCAKYADLKNDGACRKACARRPRGVVSSSASMRTSARRYCAARSHRSGPQPASTVRPRGTTPALFSIACAPPAISTPGSVQPGNRHRPLERAGGEDHGARAKRMGAALALALHGNATLQSHRPRARAPTRWRAARTAHRRAGSRRSTMRHSSSRRPGSRDARAATP